MAKLSTVRKLLSLAFLGLNVVSFFFQAKGQPTTSLYILTVSDSVLFICNETFKLRRKWKYEDSVLFNNAAMMDERFKNNVVLLANYSLLMNPVLIQNEGSYECLNGSLPVRRYHLIVKGCINLLSSQYLLKGEYLIVLIILARAFISVISERFQGGKGTSYYP